MIEQLLLLFQALFLVLLYLFIWRLMRSASSGLRIPEQQVPASGAAVRSRPVLGDRVEAALVVLASDSIEPGSVIRAGGAVSIGRALDNTVALPDDEFASTRHARIEIGHDTSRVVDLDSRNGTFVNGERVINTRHLRPDDVVRVGATELKFSQ